MAEGEVALEQVLAPCKGKSCYWGSQPWGKGSLWSRAMSIRFVFLLPAAATFSSSQTSLPLAPSLIASPGFRRRVFVLFTVLAVPTGTG